MRPPYLRICRVDGGLPALMVAHLLKWLTLKINFADWAWDLIPRISISGSKLLFAQSKIQWERRERRANKEHNLKKQGLVHPHGLAL